MPRYLFTFHAHGTWMPDHPRGYVHRTRGLQPFDPEMADAYRSRQREPPICLTKAVQRTAIAAAQQAVRHLDATLHAIACEPTHVHVLIGWRHDRSWKSMRTSLQSALTRTLNEQFEKRVWWAENSSRKRVKDYAHFDYLMIEYLPKHRGEQWLNPEDLTRSARRR